MNAITTAGMELGAGAVSAGSPVDGVPVWVSTLLLFAVLAGGAWVAFSRRAWGWTAGLGGGAGLLGASLVRQISWSSAPVLLAVAVAVVVGVSVWWSRSETVVTRWGNRSRRKSGVASFRDIWRKASPHAMRGRARIVRPSLAGLSRWELFRTPVSEFAVMLCRVGRQQVWASSEVVVLVFGSPRKGKSAHLAGRVLDAPGAVVATSTKLDLLRATGELRSRRGPVSVFNPGGDGGAEAASTTCFPVLTGCCDPVTASYRAGDMVSAGDTGGGGGDREYWDGQARRVLAALLHAAALGGYSMMDVQRWVADPAGGADQVLAALRGSRAAALVADFRQFVKTNERTQTSITSSVMPALAWLAHPAAAIAGDADGTTGLPALDVASLLEQQGTVFLLGGEEAPTAPLVCALTGYIAREARRIAALAPGERLDPHLTMVLDEAAQICPIPLDRWSADMGGRGLCIVAGFQSRAQMIARYGRERAAVTLNNAGAKQLFGGTSDRDDAAWWSNLAGERDEEVVTRDRQSQVSSRSVRRVPVIAPSELLTMEEHRVVVFAPGMPVVVGWAERYWRRTDVRALRTPNALDLRARRAVAGIRRWFVWVVPAGARGVVRTYRWTAAGTSRWVTRQVAELVWSAACALAWLRRLTGATPTPVPPTVGESAGELEVADPVNPEPAVDAGPVGTEPARAEPLGSAGAGAQVYRFPVTEWSAEEATRRPAALPAGEWTTETHSNGNGHGEPGGPN